MGNEALDRMVATSMFDIEHVISEVARRGSKEVLREADRYEELRLRQEFKELITAEIYEAFFLPERHESDWQIIHQIVANVCNPAVGSFVAGAVASGLIENASGKLMGSLLSRTLQKMKASLWPKKRVDPYEELSSALDCVKAYFKDRKCSRLLEIEAATSLSGDRIKPILKLLGFVHHRRQYNCYWCVPGYDGTPG